MSLYADYIREITNDFIIETEEGFATYRYLNEGKTVYIVDIYVVPNLRGKRITSKLANLIAAEAKAKGCKELIGTINPISPCSTSSMKAQFHFGMQLHSISNNAIILRKDI